MSPKTYTLAHSSIAACATLTAPDGSQVDVIQDDRLPGFVVGVSPKGRDLAKALPREVRETIEARFRAVFALPYHDREAWMLANPSSKIEVSDNV